MKWVRPAAALWICRDVQTDGQLHDDRGRLIFWKTEKEAEARRADIEAWCGRPVVIKKYFLEAEDGGR